MYPDFKVSTEIEDKLIRNCILNFVGLFILFGLKLILYIFFDLQFNSGSFSTLKTFFKIKKFFC